MKASAGRTVSQPRLGVRKPEHLSRVTPWGDVPLSTPTFNGDVHVNRVYGDITTKRTTSIKDLLSDIPFHDISYSSDLKLIIISLLIIKTYASNGFLHKGESVNVNASNTNLAVIVVII